MRFGILQRSKLGFLYARRLGFTVWSLSVRRSEKAWRNGLPPMPIDFVGVYPKAIPLPSKRPTSGYFR